MSTSKVSRVEAIEWISVDNDMPDEGISVLVACGIDCDNDSSGLDVFEAVREDGVWKGPSGEYMEQRVCFWAEMPECKAMFFEVPIRSASTAS
jgi:hypothetical protein